MYTFILRPLFFLLPPELAHCLALTALKWAVKLKLMPVLVLENNPITIMGLVFPNRVGLAAGLDKNGEYIDGLAALGFGFIEVGTVTPKPQSGNPKPRLFRLKKDQALINRMGFNNKGVDYLIEQIKKSQYQGILGINLGKNAATPISEALSDYLIGMQKTYFHASYQVINISSPNTPGLRELQFGDYLGSLCQRLKQEQSLLAEQHKKTVPLLIKIAPDVSASDVKEMARVILEAKIDGVIATNTAILRPHLEEHELAAQTGGLSGKPLAPLSIAVVEQLDNCLNKQVPIIGVGGIMDTASAKAMRAAGADLVQLYTGIIYQGPGLVKRVVLG